MSLAATTRLELRVPPGARRPGVGERHGDVPSDLEVVSGHASREKIVLLNGLEQARAERLLSEAGGGYD